MKEDKRLIQSILRATEVMGLFVDENRPLGITDFSRRLGLPKTTVAGIVSTLVSAGYLEKYPFTAKYRLGPQLLKLGMKCTANADLVAIGRTWLERLCLQFMEPVNMGMFMDNKVRLVMRIEPGGRYVIFPHAGLVLPAHTSSLGKTLLAYMNESERDRVLSGYHFEKLTPNTITDRELFLEELQQVRDSGVSFDHQETVMGVAAIGGPMLNHNSEVIASFAVAGNPDSIMKNRASIMEAVKFTSYHISSQLGFTG